MSTSSQSQWTKTANALNFATFCVFLLLKPFRKLQGTMDTHFWKLRQASVWAEVKDSGTISPHEEDLFWELGNLGTSTPLALLRSVFYYNGKVLCLHGGDEHRQLKFSQLKRVSKGYIYTENGSGGVAQMKIENKVVPSYTSANAEDKEWCHVYLLNLYMEKVPKDALSKDAFYLRPVAKVSDTLFFFLVRDKIHCKQGGYSENTLWNENKAEIYLWRYNGEKLVALSLGGGQINLWSENCLIMGWSGTSYALNCWV